MDGAGGLALANMDVDDRLYQLDDPTHLLQFATVLLVIVPKSPQTCVFGRLQERIVNHRIIHLCATPERSYTTLSLTNLLSPTSLSLEIDASLVSSTATCVADAEDAA